MDLSIITVNYNTREDVINFINSIKTQVHKLTYEIFVIDNNSQDGSAEAIKKMFPEVKLIANQENKGYATAMNQGYYQSTGKYVAFMNPDMILKNDCFTPLIERLQQDDKIGIIAPTLLYKDGNIQPTVKRDPNLWSQILIMLKLHHLIKSKSIDRYLAKDFDYSKEAHVQQLMGAFIMGRRKAIETFQAWDEDYPLWWEDLQICKDSRTAGYYNLYTPIAQVFHLEGTSFAKVLNLTKQKRFNYGMRLYFKKNYGFGPYVILLAIHPLSMFLAWVVQLMKIKPRTQSQLTTKK